MILFNKLLFAFFLISFRNNVRIPPSFSTEWPISFIVSSNKDPRGRFRCRLWICCEPIASGYGASRTQAMDLAAKASLDYLRKVLPPDELGMLAVEEDMVKADDEEMEPKQERKEQEKRKEEKENKEEVDERAERKVKEVGVQEEKENQGKLEDHKVEEEGLKEEDHKGEREKRVEQEKKTAKEDGRGTKRIHHMKKVVDESPYFDVPDTAKSRVHDIRDPLQRLIWVTAM